MIDVVPFRNLGTTVLRQGSKSSFCLGRSQLAEIATLARPYYHQGKTRRVRIRLFLNTQEGKTQICSSPRKSSHVETSEMLCNTSKNWVFIRFFRKYLGWGCEIYSSFWVRLFLFPLVCFVAVHLNLYANILFFSSIHTTGAQFLLIYLSFPHTPLSKHAPESQGSKMRGLQWICNFCTTFQSILTTWIPLIGSMLTPEIKVSANVITNDLVFVIITLRANLTAPLSQCKSLVPA